MWSTPIAASLTYGQSRIIPALKILIAGAPSKFPHLVEFKSHLERLGNECKLIHTEVYDGFPSKRVSAWLSAKKRTHKICDEFRPDLILSDRADSFCKFISERNVPVALHLRGDYWSEVQWVRESVSIPRRGALRLKARTAEQCFKEARIILPICNYLKNIVDSRYPNKSRVWYGGIDPEKWHRVGGMDLKHPCVGLLQGAGILGKAREMMLLPKVITAYPNVMFYWAGDGEYRDMVLNGLQKYPNFKWLGPLSYPDGVRKYLSEIDIYALITGIDMSPLTLQEAQLLEKPVIATNVGGVPEIMRDGQSGFLTKQGSSDDIIQKISTLLSDTQKATTMGKTGRKFVEEEFNWDKITKDFLSMVKPIVV